MPQSENQWGLSLGQLHERGTTIKPTNDITNRGDRKNVHDQLVCPLGAAALTLLLAQAGAAQEALKLGISAPMSGAAASWGLGMEWAAEQAAERVNEEGGVTANGKTYMFDIVSYDNKYSATEGARNAQTMLNRDGIDYIAGSIGRWCNLRSGNSLGAGAMSPCWGAPQQGLPILVFHGVETQPWRRANGQGQGYGG